MTVHGPAPSLGQLALQPAKLSSTRCGLARERGPLLSMAMRLFDVMIVAAAYLVSTHLLALTPALPDPLLALTLALLAALTFQFVGVYRQWCGQGFSAELSTLLQGSLIWGLLALVPLQLAGVAPGAGFMATWIIASGLLLLSRLALRCSLAALRKRGWNQRRVALVGYTEACLSAHRSIDESPWLGYEVVGYVDDRRETRDGTSAELPYLGAVCELEGTCRQGNVDEVWVCLPARAEDRMRAVYDALRNSTANIALFMDVRAFHPIRHEVTEIGGMPMVYLTHSPMSEPAQFAKSVLDRLLAGLAILALAPLMILITLAIKLTSPGPVLFRQTRVGWNNRTFTMLKFRSMTYQPDLRPEDDTQWTRRADPRCTLLGTLLRRTSLDELPQFFNVLRGDMSIVGPRPERPHLVERFKDEIPWYMKKHMVKAGITGWAQVNGLRGDTDLRTRIEHDLYYIDNWSLGFDLRIMLLTVSRGLINANAH